MTLRETFGALFVIVPHDSGLHPGTVMSVVIGEPVPCTAVAVDTARLRFA